MKKREKKILALFLIFASTLMLAGCKEEINYQDLVLDAQKEGKVESLAMPDDWANWDETWLDLSAFYGISHTDMDMNSAQELEQFQEGTGDIGDVGFAYAKQAEKEGLTLKYKSSYWDEIPDWAKDDDGDWVVTYTGTIAFMVKDAEPDIAMSWQDILESNDVVNIAGDVSTASLAQYTVYAAAVAFGGDADNIQPGIDFFKQLAEEGRLTDVLYDNEELVNSNVDVVIKWDFIALNYRDMAETYGKQYGVCIPSDGSVTVGYASVINEDAEHPNAAKLAREYILSDAGQLNLANGYATPIRSIVLPKELEDRRIDRDQYKDEMVENGLEVTDETVQKIIEAWNDQVIPILNEKGRAK